MLSIKTLLSIVAIVGITLVNAAPSKTPSRPSPQEAMESAVATAMQCAMTSPTFQKAIDDFTVEVMDAGLPGQIGTASDQADWDSQTKEEKLAALREARV